MGKAGQTRGDDDGREEWGWADRNGGVEEMVAVVRRSGGGRKATQR